MSQWKTSYIAFQKAYKNRIKVFLEVPRIRPSQDDDTFDDMLRIASDGSLVEYALKISPHFDADKTALYLKTNEELSKIISSIKTKEQCEQLKLLLALDLCFLNGSDYVWEKPDGTSFSRPTNPMIGLIRYGEAAADESASDESAREPPKAREPKDPHDFKSFWDPGDLEAIPWDDLSYDADANFTAKRSHH